MHPVLLLLAFSTLACALAAGMVCAQARARGQGVAGGMALLGCAVWGLGQIFFHLDPDPQRAVWIARAAMPAGIFVGPLCFRAFLGAGDFGTPLVRRLQFALYANALVGSIAAIATPSVIAGAQPAAWGRALEIGPAFVPFYALNLLGCALGPWFARSAAQQLGESQRAQLEWMSRLVLLPIVACVLWDLALPHLGYVLPTAAPTIVGPFAVLSFAVRLRFGGSPLTPARVADKILEILPDGVALLHADETIRVANGAMARLCGCQPRDLVGRPLRSLIVQEVSSTQEREALDEMEAKLRGASGGLVPVALSSTVYRDGNGTALGRVVVVRDLREVAALRGRLIVSARLAAVGELAAGIAHEINNPLAFVRANLSQLESHWKLLRPRLEGVPRNTETTELVQDVDDLIGESTEGVDRAVEIVRGVKSFAHAGSSSREIADLQPLLADTLKVASTQLRGRVNVIEAFDEDLAAVLCAPQQLKQVFLNLVVNAAQAVEDGGTVLIATRPDGDHVVVSVADDGCGIPPESIDRIFDPFFTTKSVGEGTGLGLGIAHQIIAAHGGEIQVESEVGMGTVFRVRLPAAEN